MKAFARYWLPALGWMALIWVMSSDVGSGEHSASILIPVMTWLFPWATPDQIALLHTLVRKLGHLTEYAILAALWFRGLVGERRLTPAPSAWLALAVSVVWAVLDEAHQGTIPSRTASAGDVMIDAVGATLAVLAARRRRGNRVRSSDADPAYPAARPRTS